MNELSATVVKNQPFQLLWCPFLYLRLKLNRLESNSVVTRELITLFYVESANQHLLQSIKPPLLHGLQYSILQVKKNLDRLSFFIFIFLFSHTPSTSVFFKNEANNLWMYFHYLITCMFHLQFWQNLCHYFCYVYPTNRPEVS